MFRQEKIKILWLFFTIYFVIVSLGLPLHKHYCLGDLKKIQLFIQPESCHASEHHEEISDCCSGKCSKENEYENTFSSKEGDCCTDKLEFYKIEITSTKEDIQKSKVQKPLVLFSNNAILNSYSKITGKIELQQYNRFIIFWKIPDPRTKLTLHQQFIC